ncbi:MAG: TonB-dependent receptor [Paludibacter sp.]|nr:TonB-dependent receptor [Paludibacter sp.]
MRKKIIYLLLAVFVSTGTLLAQNLRVNGVIVDKKTGETLIGANVVQKGTTNGTVTNLDGAFSLSVPQGSVLIMSYLGYISQEVVVSNEAPLRIQLVSNTELLDEVVVVGYGTQKVKDMTAPISTVKGSDLTKQLTSNPMSAMQGKMSGVQIVNSGVPGQAPDVKIRGLGSIGDYGNPLYIVDGVFVDNINFLSSGDIEDLTVLKDASAAAIYGVRAANGVVLVTTKKGKMDQINVSYDGYVGYQIPVNIMKLANKDQYVQMLNDANASITGYVPKVAANYPTSTDWYSQLVRPALTHSHSLDISGATEKTNYSFGGNYFYQEGIMNAVNDYERYNFRARLDQNVTDWLKMGFNTVISNYTRNIPNNDAFFQAFINPPVYSPYDDANTAAYPVNFGSPQQYGFGNQYGNPLASAYYNNNKEDGMNLIFSTFAEFTLSPKLKFKSSYNLNYVFYKSQNYTPQFNVGGSQGVMNSNLSKTFSLTTKQIIDNLLTYTDKIGQHSFNILLGQSTRIEKQSSLTGTAINVPGFDDQSIYLTTGSFDNRYANDGAYRYNGLSFFTRGTYNFNDRYLATVTFRADGSSKYQDKWGYFPSIGLGWIMTGEEFMKNQSFFQYLKARASYGMLGNDNIPANSSVTLGTTGAGSSAIFGNTLVTGVGAQTVVQSFLKWEVVNEFDFGFDFSIVNQKLNGSLDYYNRITNNVVFSAPIATGGGVAELLTNNGSVQNQGIELNLNWTEKINNDLSYNIGFNATTIVNKVLALNGRSTPIPGALIRGNYATQTKVGYPIGSFFGYDIAGVYASESEALRDPVSQTIKDAGYFKYKDQNGDNVIDEKDKVFLGSAIPWLTSGVDFGLNYKQLDVSVTIQGQFGNKILNAKRMNRDVFADANYDLNFYQNAWTSTNHSTKYPSAAAYNTSFIQQANSFFVEDGSYVRIQNIQIGYTFDKVLGMKNLRVYASAQRPFTYFSYNGFSPEVSGSPISNGVDTNVYPMQAVYSVGLKLNL